MAALMDEIENRRARRALSEEKIPDAVLGRLMTAATYAPSCFNSQSWRFLVANSNEALEKMHTALSGGNYWATRAPVLITHYQRLLNHIVPDFVHVMYDGRLVRSGDKDLALELEAKGYAWLKKELAHA